MTVPETGDLGQETERRRSGANACARCSATTDGPSLYCRDCNVIINRVITRAAESGELSAEDIAAEVGLSHDAVLQRLSRMRRAMKQAEVPPDPQPELTYVMEPVEPTQPVLSPALATPKPVAPAPRKRRARADPQPSVEYRFRVLAQVLGMDPDSLLGELMEEWIADLREKLYPSGGRS